MEEIMSDLILRAENIFFTYEGDNTPALNGLSLSIKKGKKTACMGSNGSGKSTFFLCCNGIRRPDSGTLYYNDMPVNYTKKGLLDLRRKVGIVFQDPDNQLFSASVAQEISFGPLNLGLSEAEARQKTDAVMERLGITPFAHKPVHALSDGQKKLVAIADILVMEPELIIFDEPAAALDPLHTERVREIIDEVAGRGTTVLLATHDADYAFTWADEVLVFHRGQLLKSGSPQKIFSNEQLLMTANLKQPLLMSLLKNPDMLNTYRKEYML